jgi:NAD(P)H-hydrate epimerase
MRNPKIEREIRKAWPPRSRRAHKTDFGRVFILAGSRGLTGAAALSGLGALRAGAGLVTLGCPDVVYLILARRYPEVMVRPFPSTSEGTLSEKGFAEISRFLKTQDVAAVGPGLGRHPSTRRLVKRLLRTSPVPMVVDADGVNAFEGNPAALKRCSEPIVLTPHPGEFVRVFGGRKPATDSERRKKALEVARKYKKILVLKGYRTVIAPPSGKASLNPTGNPGMATGGTGDVLTGIIAALIGQGIAPFQAARFGVYLHGLAGDLAARKKGEISLVASDLIELLPEAIQRVFK